MVPRSELLPQMQRIWVLLLPPAPAEPWLGGDSGAAAAD
jgi:hypothetical protein